MTRIHDIPEGHKRCSRCGCVKERSQFQANAYARDKKQSWCIECRREYRQRPEVKARERQHSSSYRKRHPERVAASHKAWRDTHLHKHRQYQQAYRDRLKAEREALAAAAGPKPPKPTRAERAKRYRLMRALRMTKQGDKE